MRKNSSPPSSPRRRLLPTTDLVASKRPSPPRRRRRPPPRRKKLDVEISDDNRAPFPGLSIDSHKQARYEVTALGRVYRDDGRLLAVSRHLRVCLCSGRFAPSLPAAVAKAFGHPPPAWQDQWLWRAWVDPTGPVDELTGRLSCAANLIRYVPHAEIVRYAHYGYAPKYRPTTIYPVIT